MDIRDSFFAYCNIIYTGKLVAYDGCVKSLFNEICSDMKIKVRLLYGGHETKSFVIVYLGVDFYAFTTFLAQYQAMLFDQYGILLNGMLSFGNFELDGDYVAGDEWETLKKNFSVNSCVPAITLDQRKLQVLCIQIEKSVNLGRSNLYVAYETRDGVGYETHYIDYISALKETMLSRGRSDDNFVAGLDFELTQVLQNREIFPILNVAYKWIVQHYKKIKASAAKSS